MYRNQLIGNYVHLFILLFLCETLPVIITPKIIAISTKTENTIIPSLVSFYISIHTNESRFCLLCSSHFAEKSFQLRPTQRACASFPPRENAIISSLVSFYICIKLRINRSFCLPSSSHFAKKSSRLRPTQRAYPSFPRWKTPAYFLEPS